MRMITEKNTWDFAVAGHTHFKYLSAFAPKFL